MVAGYHASMENLERFLDWSWMSDQAPTNPFGQWGELVAIYREHISDHCPAHD
jgi:hypothetical protein